MRLDKFLKVSGLIPRRTVAKEACDAGRVRVNGRSARASAAIAAGDRIELDLGRGRTCVEVLRVPTGAVRKDERAELFRPTEETSRPGQDPTGPRASEGSS